MNSDHTTRRRLGGLTSTGSFLLLLAAVCSSGFAREPYAAQPARQTVRAGRAQPADVLRARLLGQLSLGRRQALRSGVRGLFPALLCLPASLAYTAGAPKAPAALPDGQPGIALRFRSEPLFERPPPFPA